MQKQFMGLLSEMTVVGTKALPQSGQVLDPENPNCLWRSIENYLIQAFGNAEILGSCLAFEMFHYENEEKFVW